MACRRNYNNQATTVAETSAVSSADNTTAAVAVNRLLFGVDSKIPADDLLQNNLTEFEWVKRNKVYPNFWGRNIVGDGALTKDEIDFLHSRGCKIAPVFSTADAKKTEEQGLIDAKRVDILALELGIPQGTAIFLEISDNEDATAEYMKGFAEGMGYGGFVAGFKANTDAAYSFDRQFSRGMQLDSALFSKCLVWAVAPFLSEYDNITTSHLIHPDSWTPFAPSGITRNDIAIWQYGKDCHPIHDDAGKMTVFNLDLVRNENVIIENMF